MYRQQLIALCLIVSGFLFISHVSFHKYLPVLLLGDEIFVFRAVAAEEKKKKEIFVFHEIQLLYTCY